MPTFTFQDIFKSSFLERLDSVSLLDTAIALALAFLVLPVVELVKLIQRRAARRAK